MSIRTIFSNTFKRFSGLNANQQQLLSNYNQRFDDSYESSGLRVSVQSGLRLDTVYTAIKRIADSVASTPAPVYQFVKSGKNKAKDHPVQRVLNVQASRRAGEMTSFTWKHVTITHLLGWGNAFSEIERDNAGRVIGLNPMHPDDVKIAGRNPKTEELVYQWMNNQGNTFYFPASDVLHIRGLSFDGVMGISPIMQMRNLVGRASAREEYQTRFYANGALLGGVISVNGELNDDALARYRKSFDQFYRGPKNSGKILLLEGAAKYDPLGVNPRDAMFIETSKLDAARIAAVFGIPMQFLNETETTTRASAEQLFREFLALGLNTLFCNVEQQMNVALFTRTEQESFYVEFDREALIQSDLVALVQSLKDKVLTALMTPNEGRAGLNLEPLPGGDVLICPVNYVPLDQLGNRVGNKPLVPAEKAPPEPPPSPSEPQKKSLRSVQKRSKNERKAIVKSQQVLLNDAFERVGKRERQDLAKAIQKNKGDISSFLDSYYADDSDFRKYFAKTMKPLVDSTSNHVQRDVSAQLDTEVGNGEDFATGYLETLTLRYTSASRNQLKKVIDDLPADASAEDALSERLTEWENGTSVENPSRPQKESRNEAVRLVEAMARAYMAVGGVQRLVWSGGDCPMCSELDGKVVGIDEAFVEDGDDLGNGYTADGSFMHPPIHQGCNCSVDPE